MAYCWLLPALGILLVISCKDPIIDRRKDYKPNIYLYPEGTATLEVSLDFPQGGNVLVSLPEYGTGWRVVADSLGWIDNQYEYLFYESEQPDAWQRKEGWVVAAADLETFFIENLTAYGFAGREIVDFTAYWLLRLRGNKQYAIYLQTGRVLDALIRMELVPEPDNLLRMHYLIVGADGVFATLKAPIIDTSFKRQGFYVAEWGVIL